MSINEISQPLKIYNANVMLQNTVGSRMNLPL